jgi:hypothetical protein
MATSNIVDVPACIRDLSRTTLERDQAAGSKIQSLSIIHVQTVSDTKSAGFGKSLGMGFLQLSQPIP